MNNQQGSTLGEEKSKTYTATFNLTATTSVSKVTFGMNGSVTDTDGEPSDLNINDYAYNTSRAVPVYAADGNYWSLRSTSASATSTGDSYPFNILEDMENSYRKQKNNSVTARAQALTTTSPRCLKIPSLLSYSVSNNYTGNYHGQNTWYGRTLTNATTLRPTISITRIRCCRRRRAERDPDRPPRLFGACGARLRSIVRTTYEAGPT